MRLDNLAWLLGGLSLGFVLSSLIQADEGHRPEVTNTPEASLSAKRLLDHQVKGLDQSYLTKCIMDAKVKDLQRSVQEEAPIDRKVRKLCGPYLARCMMYAELGEYQFNHFMTQKYAIFDRVVPESKLKDMRSELLERYDRLSFSSSFSSGLEGLGEEEGVFIKAFKTDSNVEETLIPRSKALDMSNPRLKSVARADARVQVKYALKKVSSDQANPQRFAITLSVTDVQLEDAKGEVTYWFNQEEVERLYPKCDLTKSAEGCVILARF